MKEVHIALHSATHAEREAVKHWLHPAHTADSILMNLGLIDDLKKDAAKTASDIKTDVSNTASDIKKTASDIKTNVSKTASDIKTDAAKTASHIKTDAAKTARHIKTDATKAIHAVEVAGQLCGSNSICVEIAEKGATVLEGKETALVMGWVNNNKKAAWCKGNSICMEIVHKALSTATAEETKLVNEWLHQPTIILMVLWEHLGLQQNK